MIPVPALWFGLLLGLCFTVLGTVAETALGLVNRVRLRNLIERGTLRDRAVTLFLDEPARSWLAARLVSAGGMLLGGACAAVAIAHSVGSSGSGPANPGAATAALTPPGSPLTVLLGPFFLWLITALGFVLIGQFFPSLWATRKPVEAALAVAVPLRAIAWVLSPLLAVLLFIARALGAELLEQVRGVREDELRSLVNVDDDNGPMEEEEIEMIAGIMELAETRVREVMVPRIDIVAMPIEATVGEVLDKVIEAGHSRIPVYRGTIDDVAGLLYAKDLLKVLRDPTAKPALGDLLRPVHFVPESKPVDELLAELQLSHVHMALVVDEYGGTAGLVTIEDLLEQIVGDIQDEYDVEAPEIEHLGEEEGVFSGGLDIDDANRLLDIALPTEDADTLGGLVLSELGRVPQQGERAIFPDAEIEVLDVAGRRVNRVRVTKRSPTANGHAGSVEA